MESEEKALSSKELLQKLTVEYYTDLAMAHKRGRKVAWASSIVPQEFLEAMDVEVAYPENQAAAIAAKGGAEPFLERAEAMGYSNDICSYARINLAYADIMKSDLVNIPRPDFVVCINNICSVLVKWYEDLAQYWNVPYILIDVPYNYDYNVTQDRVDYIKSQFQDFICRLEEICGKPFDYERFERVMEISNRAAQSWGKVLDYAAQKPSPLDGFNAFNYMAMMVCLRGKECAVQLNETIAAEMEAMAAAGQSQFPGKQKFRVMWDGIACWPYLSHNYKAMAMNGVVIAGSTYPKAWEFTYGKHDMDALARAYASIGNNCSMEFQADGRAELSEHCKVDGVIYHMNRSCKVMDFMQPEMRRKVYEKTGIPFITFDGDQSDPKNFSKAQFETRLQGLVETMEANRAEQEGTKQ